MPALGLLLAAPHHLALLLLTAALVVAWTLLREPPHGARIARRLHARRLRCRS